MLEVDKAVSEALRNGIAGAPVSRLVSDRSKESILSYLRSEWPQVLDSGGRIKVYEGRRLQFELILSKGLTD